jgi:hypothetical protein
VKQPARIYEVTNIDDGDVRLILAHSPARALRHITAYMFSVRSASAVAVGKLMASGVELERATGADDDSGEDDAGA